MSAEAGSEVLEEAPTTTGISKVEKTHHPSAQQTTPRSPSPISIQFAGNRMGLFLVMIYSRTTIRNHGKAV